jgi:hypothetical protein
MRQGIQEGIAAYSLHHVQPGTVDRYLAYVEALGGSGLFPEHCLPFRTISPVDLDPIDMSVSSTPDHGSLPDIVERLRLDADPFDDSIPLSDQVSQSQSRSDACTRFARLGDDVTGDVVFRELSGLYDASVTETRWLAVLAARYFRSAHPVPANSLVQLARAFASDPQLLVRNEVLELVRGQASKEPADLFTTVRQLVQDSDDNLALVGARSLLSFNLSEPSSVGASPEARDGVLTTAGKLMVDSSTRIRTIITHLSGTGYWRVDDDRFAALVPKIEPAEDEGCMLVLQRFLSKTFAFLCSPGATIFGDADLTPRDLITGR